MLLWCSPEIHCLAAGWITNHFALSRRGPGFESRREHYTVSDRRFRESWISIIAESMRGSGFGPSSVFLKRGANRHAPMPTREQKGIRYTVHGVPDYRFVPGSRPSSGRPQLGSQASIEDIAEEGRTEDATTIEHYVPLSDLADIKGVSQRRITGYLNHKDVKTKRVGKNSRPKEVDVISLASAFAGDGLEEIANKLLGHYNLNPGSTRD